MPTSTRASDEQKTLDDCLAPSQSPVSSLLDYKKSVKPASQMNRSAAVKLGRDEAHFQSLHSKLDSFLVSADKKDVYER